MVSIAAFQAVDPGSIPGWRSNFFFLCNYSCFFFLILKWKHIYQNYYHVNTRKIWTYVLLAIARAVSNDQILQESITL